MELGRAAVLRAAGMGPLWTCYPRASIRQVQAAQCRCQRRPSPCRACARTKPTTATKTSGGGKDSENESERGSETENVRRPRTRPAKHPLCRCSFLHHETLPVNIPFEIVTVPFSLSSPLKESSHICVPSVSFLFLDVATIVSYCVKPPAHQGRSCRRAGGGQGEGDADGAAEAAAGGADQQGLPEGRADGRAAQAAGRARPPRARNHRAGRRSSAPSIPLPQVADDPSPLRTATHTTPTPALPPPAPPSTCPLFINRLTCDAHVKPFYSAQYWGCARQCHSQLLPAQMKTDWQTQGLGNTKQQKSHRSIYIEVYLSSSTT